MATIPHPARSWPAEWSPYEEMASYFYVLSLAHEKDQIHLLPTNFAL